MFKIISLFLLSCLLSQTKILAQPSDSMSGKEMFNRITQALENFKPDTSQVPQDKITNKILELRNLRGGFNINEAIGFKLLEDLQKNEITQAQYDKLHAYFFVGNGKRNLDNATIWIYRKNFTYKELKHLTKFYKTSAGRKMATIFPVIMLQSLAAAETIKNWLDK